jgi:dihydrofolate reductase
VILFDMVSVDGFFEGPDHSIDWHNTDDEFNDFAAEQLDAAGGLLFGRVTYQLMAGYWPTPTAIEADPIIAGQMNGLAKYVFSGTLQDAPWANTTLVTGDAAAEVARLKQQPGRDLLLFGSADLAASLTAAGLINEYRLMVNPVVLGRGTPLFKAGRDPLALRLLSARPFGNGNVLLAYAPA